MTNEFVTGANGLIGGRLGRERMAWYELGIRRFAIPRMESIDVEGDPSLISDSFAQRLCWLRESERSAGR